MPTGQISSFTHRLLKPEANIAKQRATESTFEKQKQEFEKLRSDVQIKLKFLDENRVRVLDFNPMIAGVNH